MNDIFILDEVLDRYVTSADTDPCLCGSGKPFVKCHKIDEKLHSNKNVYQIFNKLSHGKQTKQCYMQGDDCSEVYTYSHSIPRQSLENIQENRHVLKFKMPVPITNFEDLHTYSLNPIREGINEVGCYYGFCNRHDTQLFAPIETEPVLPTSLQALLTRFRSTTKELYNKTQTTEFISVMKDVAAKKEYPHQRTLVAVQSAQLFSGTFRSLTEYYSDFRKIKSIIEGKYPNIYRSRCYIFDDRFPVQCCSYTNPTFSPSGTRIQDWNDFSTDCQYFSMNSFYKDGKTYFIFTWPKGSVLELFFSELAQLISGRETSFLVQFAFAFSENHAFRPSWWEGLSLIKKKRITRLYLQEILEWQTPSNMFDEFRSSEYSDSQLIEVIDDVV